MDLFLQSHDGESLQWGFHSNNHVFWAPRDNLQLDLLLQLWILLLGLDDEAVHLQVQYLQLVHHLQTDV